MTPKELYEKHLCSRKNYEIHRAIPINPNELPMTTEEYRVTPEGRLEGKLEDNWIPTEFTGVLKWYAGSFINLLGTFKDGFIQEVEFKD
jgi:hypothetical protein